MTFLKTQRSVNVKKIIDWVECKVTMFFFTGNLKNYETPGFRSLSFLIIKLPTLLFSNDSYFLQLL